ncbi:hypothetical protein [Halotalea alkalilenta]|nr:hypothetical protein [Halotalea alkalilenta]
MVTRERSGSIDDALDEFGSDVADIQALIAKLDPLQLLVMLDHSIRA